MTLSDFERLPSRVFLDTSAVNLILEWEEQVFGGTEIPVSCIGRTRDDVLALRGVFLTGQRASWPMIVSPTTYSEVARTRNQNKLSRLLNWTEELLAYSIGGPPGSGAEARQLSFWTDAHWQEHDADCLEREWISATCPNPALAATLIASGSLDMLPDHNDRRLVAQAMGYGCDAFCTRDWRTILRYRDKLTVPIRIMTPAEWWRDIEPWAGLWY